MKLSNIFSSAILLQPIYSHEVIGSSHQQLILDLESSPELTVPYDTRVKWMRRAVEALTERRSPCPFEAFGSAIVNHTDGTTFGTEICVGANAIRETGNPTIHGEIAAINNCSFILTDPDGPYALSPAEAGVAWKSLSLYTTAEACPMCATAIRWAGFREYIYATSTDKLLELKWPQVQLSSRDLFKHTHALPGSTSLIGDVATNETNPLFEWQFQKHVDCPSGCSRSDGGECTAD